MSIIRSILSALNPFRWFGKSDHEQDHDEYPQEYGSAFHAARARAVSWYLEKYGTSPKIPYVKLVIEDKPRNNMGGWTANPGVIHIWRDQYPFDGSLEHEFRHSLCKYNLKPFGEGDVA